MIATVSNTRSPRRRSPSSDDRAIASAFGMPFVNNRHATSPSIVTEAEAGVSTGWYSPQHPGSRTSEYRNRGSGPLP